MAFKSGVYECFVVEDAEGGMVNIPVGERLGIMPWWIGAMIIVGAVFGFRGNQPYLYLSRVLLGG